ncbi:MAG: hypothetical protein BWY49_00131 [Candidatus Omnitrophica bacterium ADurb.Bin314]|nr:MAG: hypothetical protein BWY49_00131 [Candidatus Omnitrophica bacterium ADurb.Bin314]
MKLRFYRRPGHFCQWKIHVQIGEESRFYQKKNKKRGLVRRYNGSALFLPLNGCANATHRRPAFLIEIPILLYRVAKGEWKIKKVVNETTAPRRIYDPIKYRPRVVRAPYPGPMGH